MALLELRDLSVSLAGRAVLRGVSLSAEAGEVVGIFGPSGAGKSTLFRALVGEVGFAGEARVGGRALAGVPVWKKSTMGLGYVPQGPSVLFDLTVAGNLLTFGALSGRRVDAGEWAARVGLGKQLEQRASTLSGGERRRLELARALLCEPRVLLCDEPFAGLNPLAIEAVGGLLREAAEGGVAVVLTDHHMDEALALASRALLLLDGAVELSCGAGEFAAHPLVRERYVGRARPS